MTMRRIRYNAAISLDGFIASPDGSTDCIIQDTTSIDFDALHAEFDCHVMGRKTYEAVTSCQGANPLAAKAKENVLVVSRTMKQQDYPDITILRHDFISTIRQLKAQQGRDMWFMGGGQLAAALCEARLIDVVEMAVMPAVVGEGIKMIAGSGGTAQSGYRLDLRAVERLHTSGIVILKYAVLYDC